MSFLIKDLSKLTKLSAARIRKWQERYNILSPQQGSNGYWYYSIGDQRVLSGIQYYLSQGKRLHKIMDLGRQYLLMASLRLEAKELAIQEQYHIQLIKEANYALLKSLLLKQKKLNLQLLVCEKLQPLVVSVGKAWELGLITVADEHAFTRWFSGFLLELTNKIPLHLPYTWLVCSFPGDEHELGALMHYCLLRSQRHSVRYVGMLPRLELLNEIRERDYKNISISIVMPRLLKEQKALAKSITHIRPGSKVHLGGRGLNSETSCKN